MSSTALIVDCFIGRIAQNQKAVQTKIAYQTAKKELVASTRSAQWHLPTMLRVMLMKSDLYLGVLNYMLRTMLSFITKIKAWRLKSKFYRESEGVEKEEFLSLFKKCVKDGDIKFELLTEKDSYYGDTQTLTVIIGDEEISKSVG